MERDFYVVNWTEAEKKFITDNIQYLKMDGVEIKTSSVMDVIMYNKLIVEHGLRLTTENGSDKLLLAVGENRHYWELGKIGSTSYEELLSNIKKEVAVRDMSMQELKDACRFTSLFWYTDIREWEIAEGKITFYVKNEYATSSITDFLLYAVDGKVRENLKDANAEAGDYRLCYGNFETEHFIFKCAHNGRTVIKLDKIMDVPSFIERIKYMQDVFTRMHKNCAWYTWTN